MSSLWMWPRPPKLRRAVVPEKRPIEILSLQNQTASQKGAVWRFRRIFDANDDGFDLTARDRKFGRKAN